MSVVVLPIITSMILGRCIDLRTYRVTSSVFSNENYQKIDEVSSSKVFNVIDYSNATGNGGDFSLYIKANFITLDGELNGLEEMAKDVIWEENTIFISINMAYLTSKRKLAEDAPVLENGMNAAYLANSTHYVKEVHYGGWFVLLHKLKMAHPNDMKKVKREIADTLGSFAVFDEAQFDSWRSLIEKIDKLDLRGKVDHKYNIYSSVPLGEEYLEPTSLLKNMDKFPDEVRKRGGGYGDALLMLLSPLNEINSTFDKVDDHSSDYGDKLDKINHMFDDLKQTQSLMLSWTMLLPVDITKEQDEQINKLLNDVDDTMQVFFSVIPEISIYKKMDEVLLKRAFDAYEKTLPIHGGTYQLAYRRLKESIDSVCQDTFHDKILGQLRLDQDEMIGPLETPRGLEECEEKCVQESRCRAIAFGEKLSALDTDTGMWEQRSNVCWVYFRSSGTAFFESSSEWIGDIYVYDRNCS